MDEDRYDDAPEDDQPSDDEAQQGAPQPIMETGRISIVVGLDENGGLQRSWGIQGMNSYEAIGHLEVMSQLIIQVEAGKWAQGMGNG